MIAEKPRKIKVFQRRASKKGIRFRVSPVMTTSIPLRMAVTRKRNHAFFKIPYFTRIVNSFSPTVEKAVLVRAQTYPRR